MKAEKDHLRIVKEAYSDTELVTGLIKKDPLMCDYFVKKYGALIDRRVWRLLGADSEHDDVVQQVFVRIFKSISTLRDSVALEAWVGMTTVNVVRNEIRRRKYRRILIFLPDPTDATVDDNRFDDQLKLRRAFGILDKMGANDRIAFVMRFIERADIKTIAECMDCSDSTVKRRVARARKLFVLKASRDPFLITLVDEDLLGNSDGKKL